MSLMISELYEALISAGAPKDKATDASEAVARHEKDMVEIKASLLIVKWLLVIILAFTLTVVLKVFL